MPALIPVLFFKCKRCREPHQIYELKSGLCPSCRSELAQRRFRRIRSVRIPRASHYGQHKNCDICFTLRSSRSFRRLMV